MKTRHESNQTANPRRTAGDETTNAREEIIDWLRDAYAMERGMEQSLKKQADNEELDPQIREQARKHLAETNRHAEEVSAALKYLDADTSTLKTGMGMMTEVTKGLASAFARDEEIKDLLNAYSMEHFEIVCYIALRVAAEKAALPPVAEMCDRILADEERMAQTLKQLLPQQVVRYLSLTTAPV
jgi:ferritin-like metal-binding protein YciE